MQKHLKNIRLIIFDLDGTLVDSSRDITEALNYAIEPFGLSPFAVSETVKMVGEGLTRLVEKIMGENNASITDEVLDRFIQYYTEHLTDFTTPYPGIRETLEKLGGYKKAVISNKRATLSKNLLRQLGLLEFFDIILGSDTVPEKKPSPVPVKKVLELLKIEPDEAVMVGDSDFDITAGKGAGITTIAVTYGYRDRESLKDADFLIDNINQLLPLIGEDKIKMSERRRETRYPVSDIYQHYIQFKIKDTAENFIHATLLDFSRHGIRFKSPMPLDYNSIIDCLISAPASITKEIKFKVKIRYCKGDAIPHDFIVGAEIIDIPDKLWFRIFERVHDFISDRMGEVF